MGAFMDINLINESNTIKRIDATIALKKFEEYENNSNNEWHVIAKQNRIRFVEEYPIDRIRDLTIDEYCRGDNCFSKKIRFDLQGLASMGNAYPDTFGLYARKETNEIVLSKTFQRICNGDIDAAFYTIKDEIVKLLTDFRSIGYDAVKNIHLNSLYIYKLLIIYYPEQTFPVCAHGTLKKYCECVGLSFDSKTEMYVGIQKLIEWKSKVDAFKDWDNRKLMSFCDWLVRSDQSIDGSELIHERSSTINSDKENTTYWFISGNPDRFNVIDAFHDLGKIDWKQSTKVEVGDVVYIYLSAKFQCIKFKCKVNKVNLENPEISDDEYNISLESNGTYGRYMELEPIEEFDTELFSRVKLEQYGFSSPQGPVRVPEKVKEYMAVVQYLLHVDEMNPDKYDGSYELARETVRAYKNMNNINAVDYQDLNLLYHMVIGTWKLNVDQKKKSIDKSHLPENEKDRLKKLLDKVWKNAENKEYACRVNGNASIGMFGTGFYSFNSSDSRDVAKTFIKLCIEILDMTDDEEMYKAVERYFFKEYLGLNAAIVTELLHCIAPFSFPIMSTYFGNNTIYEYFGIELDEFKNLTTMSNNFRKIKEFRDTYFTVKNYRIYDEAARIINQDVADIEQEEYRKEPVDMGTNMFDKNIILYGPPGTGKTYSSVLYAVGICEDVPIENLKQEKYEDVLARFNQYREEGRIAFTTFHQSYGYEEFIEGIKPVVNIVENNSDNITYKIEDGVFKKFCQCKYSTEMISIEENINNSDLENMFDNSWDKLIRSISNDNNRYIFHYRSSGKEMITEYSASEEVFIVRWSNKEDRLSKKRIYKQWVIGEKSIEEQKTIKGGGQWRYKACEAVIDELKNKYKLPTRYYQPDFEKKINKWNNENHGYRQQNKVFIIDEINRGNISKIFGELITLIEESKRLGSVEELELELPYSKKKFGVPSNVYIVGTMNTADRSIALMDTALRRRFSFVEMMPDTEVLDGVIVEDDGDSLDIAKLLEVINTRIEYLYDREHTIGHAFFVPLIKEPTINKLADIFDKKVIPLLKEYFYEDYSKIQLVLGDNKKSSDEYKFIKENPLDIRDIFNGDTSDLDLPEQTYKLQIEALYKIKSYKEISKDL